MPAHMKDGPRKYNSDYNYQEVFDYFDNVDKSDLNIVSDDNNVAFLPEDQNSEELTFHNMKPTLLTAVEEELQRMHHRNNDLSSFGM